MIKRAILHVENTDKLVDFAKYLSSAGWTILSANKTEEHLRNNKIPVQQEPALVENNYYVNESYQLIRRLLLTRVDQPTYMESQQQEEDNNIFILCINITPVLNVNILAKNQTTPVRPLNLYISTVLKSAFVNYENVLILQLKTDNITKEFRTYLAAKALNLVSAYDGGLATSILRNKQYGVNFPNFLSTPFKKEALLTQGSNSHQQACFYKTQTDSGLINNFLRSQGINLSYNLTADVAFAWEQISSLFSILKNQFLIKSETADGYEYTTQFTPLTGTVFTLAVKLNSIVGAALSTNVSDSFKKTYTYDTENIKDVIFASSAVIDESAAREMINCSISAIIAPGYTPKAKEILSENKKIQLISASKSTSFDYDGKLINGGLIIQQKDKTLFDHWKVKTEKRPNQYQTDEMALGMLLVMGSRSYSTVLIKDNAVVGIAEACPSVTQAMDEVYANAQRHCKMNKTGNCDKAIADILICDTAIPFGDSVKNLIDSGITAIIHTGGANADNEFIKYCDEKGITMVFTEMSHIKL